MASIPFMTAIGFSPEHKRTWGATAIELSEDLFYFGKGTWCGRRVQVIDNNTWGKHLNENLDIQTVSTHYKTSAVGNFIKMVLICCIIPAIFALSMKAFVRHKYRFVVEPNLTPPFNPNLNSNQGHSTSGVPVQPQPQLQPERPVEPNLTPPPNPNRNSNQRHSTERRGDQQNGQQPPIPPARAPVVPVSPGPSVGSGVPVQPQSQPQPQPERPSVVSPVAAPNPVVVNVLPPPRRKVLILLPPGLSEVFNALHANFSRDEACVIWLNNNQWVEHYIAEGRVCQEPFQDAEINNFSEMVIVQWFAGCRPGTPDEMRGKADYFMAETKGSVVYDLYMKQKQTSNLVIMAAGSVTAGAQLSVPNGCKYCYSLPLNAAGQLAMETCSSGIGYLKALAATKANS